eukprot:comp20691_c0_seq1/m.26944 comp20691_c0_seq1/g.26944  ORF comp20691_c0_seq1/g.26944 comp20691_c0_seq1/m.26944 type:complete len:226 (-) comp20691_c0_seq1:637-1314(-)
MALSLKNALTKAKEWKRAINTCLAVGTAMGTGDIVCQTLERRGQENRPHDFIRTRNMFLTGVFASGPLNYWWNIRLENMLPGSSVKRVLQKVFANICFAPVFISTSFTSITLLSGRSIFDARDKIAADLPKTYAAGSMYWPFVGMIQFRFVPLHFRPIVGSLAGVFWNIYISFMANKDIKLETANEKTESLPVAVEEAVPMVAKAKEVAPITIVQSEQKAIENTA